MSEQAKSRSGSAEEVVPDGPHYGKPLPLCICDSVTPIESKVPLIGHRVPVISNCVEPGNWRDHGKQEKA